MKLKQRPTIRTIHKPSDYKIEDKENPKVVVNDPSIGASISVPLMRQILDKKKKETSMSRSRRMPHESVVKLRRRQAQFDDFKSKADPATRDDIARGQYTRPGSLNRRK